MSNLSHEDKMVIENFDRELGRFMDTIKRAQQFNLGDFLILRLKNYTGKLDTQTNSYGAPIKYKVVHIDNNGIPFIKRVNKNGEPTGRISSCIGTREDEYWRDNIMFFFELDPDYADSIILEDKDNYDPASLHRSKKDIWKAITEHNKNCKVKTQEISDVVKFFNSVKIGDTLWTSNVSSYFVQNTRTMSTADYNKSVRYNMRTYIKNSNVLVITIRDKRGIIKDITPDFFHGKALYTDRPRSYKELNI